MNAPNIATMTPDAGTAAPAAELPPPHFTHQQVLRVLSGILLCIFLAAIDQTVVIPAVPAIAADLNGFSHLAWIVTAYLLTATAATPIYGKLSDIYGRRALLLPALGLFIVASVACALSQSLMQLIIARAFQGLGGAGLMSMAQAAVADVVSPRERGRYQGYMASVWGIASIAGPILGGWVTDSLSWRWIFWINLPVGLVAMLLCHRGLKLLRVRAQPTRIDWLGAGLLTGAVTAWLLVLSWGGVELPWDSPVILSLIALGAVLVAVLVRHERLVVDPLLPPRLFAHPVFIRGVAIAFLSAVALFGATFLLPLFFQLVRGADASQSGLMVVPFLGSNAIGAFAAGQLARRLGRTKLVLMLGLAGCCAGFLLLATVAQAGSVLPAVVYMFVMGFFLGMTMPSTLVSVQNAAEHRDVGVATGSLLFLRSMGGAFGSTMVGALLAGSFAATLVRAGIPGAIDLGAMRAPGGSHAGGALAALDPGVRSAVQAGLTGGFHLAFLVCAGVLGAAFLVAASMRDLPLRTRSADTAPIAH